MIEDGAEKLVAKIKTKQKIFDIYSSGLIDCDCGDVHRVFHTKDEEDSFQDWQINAIIIIDAEELCVGNPYFPIMPPIVESFEVE